MKRGARGEREGRGRGEGYEDTGESGVTMLVVLPEYFTTASFSQMIPLSLFLLHPSLLPLHHTILRSSFVYIRIPKFQFGLPVPKFT